MLKRKKLKKIFCEIDDCVKQLDHSAIEVLDIYYGDRGVLNVVAEHKESLTSTEYYVLIAGSCMLYTLRWNMIFCICLN